MIEKRISFLHQAVLNTIIEMFITKSLGTGFHKNLGLAIQKLPAGPNSLNWLKLTVMLSW